MYFTLSTQLSKTKVNNVKELIAMIRSGHSEPAKLTAPSRPNATNGWQQQSGFGQHPQSLTPHGGHGAKRTADSAAHGNLSKRQRANYPATRENPQLRYHDTTQDMESDWDLQLQQAEQHRVAGPGMRVAEYWETDRQERDKPHGTQGGNAPVSRQYEMNNTVGERPSSKRYSEEDDRLLEYQGAVDSRAYKAVRFEAGLQDPHAGAPMHEYIHRDPPLRRGEDYTQHALHEPFVEARRGDITSNTALRQQLAQPMENHAQQRYVEQQPAAQLYNMGGDRRGSQIYADVNNPKVEQFARSQETLYQQANKLVANSYQDTAPLYEYAVAQPLMPSTTMQPSQRHYTGDHTAPARVQSVGSASQYQHTDQHLYESTRFTREADPSSNAALTRLSVHSNTLPDDDDMVYVAIPRKSLASSQMQWNVDSAPFTAPQETSRSALQSPWQVSTAPHTSFTVSTQPNTVMQDSNRPESTRTVWVPPESDRGFTNRRDAPPSTAGFLRDGSLDLVADKRDIQFDRDRRYDGDREFEPHTEYLVEPASDRHAYGVKPAREKAYVRDVRDVRTRRDEDPDMPMSQVWEPVQVQQLPGQLREDNAVRSTTRFSPDGDLGFNSLEAGERTPSVPGSSSHREYYEPY